MAGPFAWLFNLDAELEMAHQSTYNPPARVTRQLAEYGRLAHNLLAPGDRLLEDLPRHERKRFTGRLWCVTPLAIQRLRDARVEPEPHPDPAIVKCVNHRLFAHGLGAGPHDQAYVRSRGEIDKLVAGHRVPWLLKRPFSVAGRGQFRILDDIDAAIASWIEKSLETDGLIVEPLITPVREYTLHGLVKPTGDFQLGRICVQEVTERGVFRSSRLASDEDIEPLERDALNDKGATVAKALARAGYFGPFGIDAYRHRDGAKHRFCPLSEINARYTMGFAIGFGVGRG